MICPRCGHQQTIASPECIACGVILAKAQPLGARPVVTPPSSADIVDARPDDVGEDASRTLIERAAALLMDEQRADTGTLAARALLLLALAGWTWSLAAASVASNAAGQSFLHLINLVFHEAGHVVFAPFGTFMTALGGSLLQLLIPALLMVVFLTQHRDPFGAAVCCWWTGENLLDLAPYIADARRLELVLIGGKTGAEVEGHDWERILTMLGWLYRDVMIGRLAHAAGALVMIAALVWGACLVAAHWRRSRNGELEGAPL